MKIRLPNGTKFNLEENISLEEKSKVVENLIRDWEYLFSPNWNSNSIRFFLDGLANYLVWHKEEENKSKQDKDVLSIKKVEEMVGKRKSKSIPFTSLSDTQKESLGIEDGEKE